MDAEMYSYSSTATAPTVTAPFSGAALSVIAYSPEFGVTLTPPSTVGFRRFSVHRERAAHELSDLRRQLPETVRGWTRGETQHVAGDRIQTFRFVPYGAEALLALAYV